MKKAGIALIITSFILGFFSEYLPKGLPIEPFVGLAFGFFLFGIYVLIIDNNLKK